MEEPLVSIIVPVYNTAAYLDRCIESLTKQTYQAIEIILVDDGSVDGSLQILLDAQKRDARITVVQQANAGPSAARNAGLDNAKGQYIMFCDSDDAVAADWCQQMVAVIQKYPDALVVCGFYRLDESGNILRKHSIDAGIYAKDQYFLLYLPGLSGSACNKIYRRTILQEHNIRFDPSRNFAEDAVFNLQYFDYTDSILVIEDCLYYYYFYRNANTLSSQADYFQIREIYSIRLKYISSEYIDEFNYAFWLNAWKMYQEALNDQSHSYFSRLKNAKLICSDEVFQKLLLQYGKHSLDNKSFALLHHQFIALYGVLQYLSSVKRFLKNYLKFMQQ